MAEELILRLKKKRAVNRSYLTKTCNRIESGLDTLMRIELEELLEQLNESFNELKLVDHEIETLLETDDLEKELQGVEEYREKYITWRFRANKKIRQSDFHGENIPNSNSRIDENEMRHYVPSCTTVKLPKLMISKFYGNFSEWLTFWNSFDAAIHQNNSLNPIDKFNYLKSHLGGTALNTVEGFALSADNYEKAIKLLKDRFGREDILISRHMNNLLSMRPLKTSSDVRTFRELFDNLSVHIRSLESLNVSIDVYGQLLCPIIIKLLPADLNLELNKELPTGYVINDLITFLERQLTAREKSFRNEIGTGNESTSKPNLVNKHPKTRFYNEKPIATASELLNSVHKSNECVFCGKDNHGSPKCDFAANISLNEKRSLMKKKGVCYKCLRPSHLSKFCRNVVRCSICNMSSHLDVMCTKLILDRGGSSKSPTVQDETLANLSTSPDVLLPTLRVTLKGNRTEKTARAIIDTGSQRSYILHSTAMEMEYEQSRREFFRHSLFGGSSTDVVEHEVYTIHLSDINNSYRCEFEALGQPLICGSIPPVCPRSLLEGNEELDVSDLMRDRIEVLIGADIAGRLLTDDQRRISSGLVAIRTKLGWTVMGKIPPTEVRDDISSLCVTTLLSLDLENLWKLDAIGVSDAEVEKKTQSLQAEMEEHFAHTTTRDIEGRYEVALPWVQDKERIPSNKDLAENQLRSVRRKLEEVGDMKEYGQIFEEWMKQGIIEYAREDKLDGVHYLPHRPVYKRNSHTSRIRPVFNASARKRGKLSLNDCLDKGPNLIEIIPRLLNKFRKYEVGVSSDIEKAFLQIGIKEEDRDYLRFLWHTEDGRLITYRHKRVVFGITTSPYLLKATLSLHLDKAPEHLKITAEQLKSSFYVDNCLSSFQNVEETEKFVKESTELLSTACFNLRDWVSNVTDFSLMNQLNKEVNILGITWNTDRDTLTIGLEDFELIGPTTKRKVLSIASKIFDPLGVACPVTLIPKLILQETWIQKLTWDEVLPGCLVQRFWKWFSKLKHLPNIEIPRWLCFKDSYVEKTTLHIFCDASQFAYATCIFLRIEKEDRVDIQLIQARTRVAPLKKLTIPRLELLACLIGARLAANVIQDLEFEEIPRFYWTDSTNALCWIQREDNWAAFVMNRVKEIHNLSSPESWRHIPGRLNPADLPSRGCSAESLKETRWWEGPAWLKVSQEEWPKSTIIPDLEIVYSERRKTILNTLCTTRENENLFGRYSHFLRIVRITAWIYRFFNNAKIDRRKIISEDLSTEEITKSEIILIRLIQRESFSGHEDKKLQGFKLLVDSSGILRIKTKICRREDFANFRMPILLPSDHFLVSLLIRWNHETHGHAGLQTLLGILRENYWILRSRKTVKKIINQCIRCKRFTATPATVESTSLPEDRVRDAAVFEIVGVDLTGHLILKNKKKAWIVIFTCAVYRGVHLELVTSLSMEAFLQAFRRFIARRGRPLIVYSDNGTNFKGIANALKKIDFSRLKCDPTLKNITWKFIPPGAPWWGGWWERLIGMMKQLLFRILGQTSLGYEELSTVMCDVESLMNTRPLTYLTEESEDLAPLTPSLFLHEVREVGVPDLDLIDNQTLSRKYQYIKRVREDLRERFRIEYFGFLRQETRRLKTTIPLKVGDMVLIGQESLKRLHWPLARIIQLYPGKDGLVRVTKVKTSSGDKIRPIQKLYNLEITPEIRCRDPLTERSPTQEVRLTTEEDPLTSQQEQHHIDTPNVVSSYGRPIKRPNRLDLLNFSFPCLSRRDANSKEDRIPQAKWLDGSSAGDSSWKGCSQLHPDNGETPRQAAREILTKKYLLGELGKAVRELQQEYIHRETEILIEGTKIEYLCQCLEAIFIHSLKGSIAKKLTQVFSGNEDQMPEPDFWPLIKMYTPKYLLSQIMHLSQVESNIGRCRAWLRIAINEKVIASFIEAIARDKSKLSSFYKTTAFLKDPEQPFIAKQLLEGLISFNFKINYNLCILNVWEPYTLTLAGIWIPTPTPEPIMPAIDVFTYFNEIESQTTNVAVRPKEEPQLQQATNAEDNLNTEAIEIPEDIQIEGEASDVSNCNLVESEEEETFQGENSDPNDNIENLMDDKLSLDDRDIGFESGIPDSEVYGNRLSPKGGWSTSFEADCCAGSTMDDQSFDSLLHSYGTSLTERCPCTIASTPDFTEIQPNVSSSDEEKVEEDKSPSTSGDTEFEIIPKNVVVNQENPNEEEKNLFECLLRISPERGLDEQQYKCYGCRRPIGMIYGKTRLCHFTGYHYCLDCHENDEAMLPARMIHNWDFRKYTISKQGRQFLEKVENDPLMDMKALNPLIYAVIPEMATLQKLRVKLGFLRSYLFTCRESVAEELRKKIWPREHLYEHVHLLSCSDLVQIPSGFLAQVLTKVIGFATQHIEGCQLCSQKGFVCEVCDDPNIIYPYDIEGTYR
ncbi:hypothetical protein LAZ67_3003034, partial [Cordylochernes scorpioides]